MSNSNPRNPQSQNRLSSNFMKVRHVNGGRLLINQHSIRLVAECPETSAVTIHLGGGQEPLAVEDDMDSIVERLCGGPSRRKRARDAER